MYSIALEFKATFWTQDADYQGLPSVPFRHCLRVLGPCSISARPAVKVAINGVTAFDCEAGLPARLPGSAARSRDCCRAAAVRLQTDTESSVLDASSQPSPEQRWRAAQPRPQREEPKLCTFLGPALLAFTVKVRRCTATRCWGATMGVPTMKADILQMHGVSDESGE